MGGFSVYGLGILLTLEDQVSGRLGGVGDSLQQLSSKAMSLNYMGKSLMNTGKAMLSPILGLSKEIIRVGSDAEQSRITFGALYEDSIKGAQKFNEIIDYAAKTPFDIESLKDSALQFKSLGVEVIGVGSEVTDSTGKTRQLIDIMGDAGAGLSGVARNGFKDITYATREFITEGNKLSFLRRLGVDIDAVLEKGYKAENTLKEIQTKVGDTTAERLVNFADLINALHMDNLMGELSGSWETMTSNMYDNWYKFCLKAGDAGAFNAFKEGLQGVLAIGNEIVDGEFSEGFFKNLGKAFKNLMSPLDNLIGKLSGLAVAFMRLGAQHPAILNLALAIPTLFGSLFILAGAALVAESSLLILGHGLGVIARMTPKMLLLAGAFAVLNYAWKHDIGSIRTNLTTFANTVSSSTSRAKNILAMNTDDMIRSYNSLVNEYNTTGDFGAGLTAGIVKINTLWRAFVQFWNNSALSKDNIKALTEMGQMPLFEKIATWTAKIRAFFRGFADGFAELANSVGDSVKNIMSKFFPSFGNGNGKGMFDLITGKFKIGDLSNVQTLGKWTAKMLPTVLGLIKISRYMRNHNRNGNTGGGLGGLLSRIFGRGVTRNGLGGVINLLRRLGTLRIGTMSRGIANLGIIITGFTGMAAIIGGVSKLVGIKSMAVGIAGLGAIAVAMLPLSSPVLNGLIDRLQRLSRFKSKTIGKGILNLAIIVDGIAAISAVALKLVSLPLKDMSIGQMYGLVGILGLMGTIGYGLAYLSDKFRVDKYTNVLKGLGEMATMLIGLGLVFNALAYLSKYPADYGRVAKMALIIGELGVIGGALALMAKGVNQVSSLGSSKGFMSVAAGAASMAVALAAIGLVLWGLAELSKINFSVSKVDKMAEVILKLGVVGTAISGLAALIGALEIGTEGIAIGAIAMGLITLDCVLINMSGVIQTINDNTKDASPDNISKMADVILKLGKVGTAVSVLSEIVGTTPFAIAMWGVKKMGFVLEAVAGVVEKMSKFENKSDKIDKGFEIINKISSGIGEAIGSVFGGFGGGVSNGLPKIAENLASFISTLAELSVPENSGNIGTFLSSVSKGLGDLLNTEILTSLFHPIDGAKFSGFSKDLEDFCKNISPVLDSMSGLNTQGITNMGLLFDTLSGLGKAVPSTLGNIFGNDFTGTANGLAKLADAKPFFTMVANLPDTAFTNAPKFFESLSEIHYIPNANGFAQLFSGLNDFAGTANGLKSLAETKPFFDFVGNLSDTQLTNARKFFTSLSSIGNVPNTGGFFQKLGGTNNYSKLVSGLQELANTKSFFDMVGDITDTQFTNVRKFFNSLATISSVPKSGGKLQSFFGEANLGGIGDGLKSLAEAKPLFDMIGSMDGGSFSKISTFFDKIKEIYNKITTGVFKKETVDLSGLRTIGIQLGTFSSFTEGFFGNINSLNTGNLDSFMNSLSELSTLSTTLDFTGLVASGLQLKAFALSLSAFSGVASASVLEDIARGLSDLGSVSATVNLSNLPTLGSQLQSFMSTVNSISTEGLSQMSSGFTNMVSSIQSAFNTLNGILSGNVLSGMVNAVSSACSQCQGVLSNFASSGYGYGASLVNSIVSGISSNAGAIKSAISSAVSRAVSSIRIKVPSIKVGKNARGTSNWYGGLTEINERGGEIIDLPRGTRIYPHDKSVTMAFDEGMRQAMSNIKGSDNRQYDNSISFSPGSIVVQVQNATEAEAERLAELIMKKIEQKQRRKALATYAY